jgi:hypothetical protein
MLRLITPPAPLDNTVAFALGRLTYDSKPNMRGLIQHALLLTICECLFSNERRPLCYAQDPAYSEHDKQVLEAFGIKVLNDPTAFLEVNEASVVLSISPDIPVKQVITDISRPAVIIWGRTSHPYPW